MLDIIRQGTSTQLPRASRRGSRQKDKNEGELPLLRAPGIPSEKPGSMLRPIARASTLPAEFKQQVSTDFEAFEGPSLFANFKRSMTTNERVQYWQQSRQDKVITRGHAAPRPGYQTLCGNTSGVVKHTYILPASVHAVQQSGRTTSEDAPTCTNCIILTQALGRLRASLGVSEQGPRELEPELTSITETEPVNRSTQNSARSTLERASESVGRQARNIRNERSERMASFDYNQSLEDLPDLPRHSGAAKNSQPQLLKPESSSNTSFSLPSQSSRAQQPHLEQGGVLPHNGFLDKPQPTRSLPSPPLAPAAAPRFSCQPVIKSELSTRTRTAKDDIRSDDLINGLAARGEKRIPTQADRSTIEAKRNIQRLVRRTLQARTHQEPQSDEAERGRQILEDLRIQRQNQTQSTRDFCTFGPDTHPPTSPRSPSGRLAQLQAEAQLDEYGQTLRTSTYRDSQQDGSNGVQDRHY
jgi:hypothetical protein